MAHSGITLEKYVSPLMLIYIHDHGDREQGRQQVRGKTCKVDLLTKARLEVIVKDSESDRITKAIAAAAYTGKIGDGKIFIHPVDDAMRIRTAERGDIAIG